ncbi:MAG TPA: hypothetical protein VMV29_05805 [Ktedonobacterales bacterium]|nr:hypothetical protein [Ktedonobacterales bacterium]
MSSKYQREIEEILRNMDPDTPKSAVGDRIRNFQRPRPRRQGPSLSLASLSLWLLLLSVLLLLAATGLAFYEGAPTLLSGGFGVAAFVVFLLALVVGWRDRFRGSSVTMTIGRRPQAPQSPFTPYDDGGAGIVNADPTTPRPLRRNFLDGLRTRLRLMRLRTRYRQRHEE